MCINFLLELSCSNKIKDTFSGSALYVNFIDTGDIDLFILVS